MSDKPFFLAMRGVLFDNQGRVLMMQRAKSSKNQPGYWEFPGGKVDPGESFDQGLLREFKEETGFTVSPQKVLGCGEWEREEYRIAYLHMLVTKVDGELGLSHEHDDARWMTKEELAQAQVSPQLEGFRDKVVKEMM